MRQFEFSISLHFQLFNEAVVLSQICEMLALEAGRKWIMGQPRTTPKGDSLPGFYDYSYCYFDLPRQDNEELHEMLNRICDSLEPHRELFHRIRSAAGIIYFYVFWVSIGHTGETFDSELLLKLSALGIDLGIEVVGESEPENSSS